MVIDLLHNKLNGTQVIRAAIFDLLTSQVQTAWLSRSSLYPGNELSVYGQFPLWR